jgi:LmbE family N-acetylglucosaminyl deacetylase
MRTLFLFAHPDDESYGPAGTIAKTSLKNETLVVSLCDGSRPGNEQVSYERKKSFKQACDLLGARSEIYNFSDCLLSLPETKSLVENIVNNFKPEIVYTHSIGDLHKDHRIVSQSCMVACRPKLNSTVKKLYFSEMPASSDWSFSQIVSKFEPNTYVDVSNFIDLKKRVLNLYSTEIYEYPDARSVESMEIRSKFRGVQVGVKYAEAFQLIFSRD